MFNKYVSIEHIEAINKIVERHLKKRDKSHKETRFSDCERLGMDEVTKYCRKHDLPTLGTHMINANIRLAD